MPAILPRPITGTLLKEEVDPRPLRALEPRAIAPKGFMERNGINESERLLAAIVRLARKEQTLPVQIALRRLIVKCSREISLDF
jgi:hypothetical protein